MNKQRRIRLALTSDQQYWLLVQEKKPENINPCVRAYGSDSQNRKCKACRLFRRKTGYSKTYFKCALRGDTQGPGTDHRANWPACSKFTTRPQREKFTLPVTDTKPQIPRLKFTNKP